MPPTMQEGNWNDKEHQLFLEGIEKYGRGNWSQIASVVKTRSTVQVKEYGQKHFQKMNAGMMVGDGVEQDCDTIDKPAAENGKVCAGDSALGNVGKQKDPPTDDNNNDDSKMALVPTKRTRPSRSCVRPLPKEPPLRNDWTDEEKRLFLVGFRKFGKGNWVKIQKVVKSRTYQQVLAHGKTVMRKMQAGVDVFDGLKEYKGDFQEVFAQISNKKRKNILIETSFVPPAAPEEKPRAKKKRTKTESKSNINKGSWSDEEHRLFLVGLQRYGRGHWMEIARVVRTRTNAQVTNHAKTSLGKEKDDKKLFKGLAVYKRDFEGIEDGLHDIETQSPQQVTTKRKRERPRTKHVAPTVSGELTRKRRSVSFSKTAASTTAKQTGATTPTELTQVLSAPYHGHGLDAIVYFSPLLCIDIDLEHVEGCVRLEKCGCVMDFYLDSPESFVHTGNVELAIRRRLENAFNARRNSTTPLDEAVHRLVCQETDDLDDILAACERLCENGFTKSNRKEVVFGEDEVDYWTERSDPSNLNSSPLREFALLRRLACPMCVRTFVPTTKRRRKFSGADTAAVRNDESQISVCFPNFSLLDVLMQMDILQGVVIDAVMLRLVQLEFVVAKLKDDSKPMARELQRCLVASVAQAAGSRRLDRPRFVKSVQFMLVATKYPLELKQMVGELLIQELAERDIGMGQLFKLVADSEWRQAVEEQWMIPIDRRDGDPLLWTRPIARPITSAERMSPAQIDTGKRGDDGSGEAFVQDVRRVLFGRKDIDEWLAHWGLEKHKKKAEMLVGRNDRSSLLVTLADMSRDTFLTHADLMNRVNESIPRPLDRPGSRPRMQALAIPDDSMSRIKSLFFDMDGSLRNEIRNDVEMSLKHGYINFQNMACNDERYDKRWQLPIKQHCKVRKVGPRSGLANELENLGIVNLLHEQLDDVGLLMGGTEDQSLHHDVSRTFTSFASSTKYDPEEEDPIAGWEVGRLAYNEAMSSSYAPSSILLGMNDSQKVLLGVQKDQIKRIEATSHQCTIVGGTEQVLHIVCEREHLVVLEVDKGVMFSGDFPHAGVRNVPEDSPENELLEQLNSKISAILGDTTLQKREALDAIVDMLCNFKGLSKLCRLFCSTEMLDGTMKNSKNAVGFSDCFANPPGDGNEEVVTTNDALTKSLVPQVSKSHDDDDDGDDDDCEVYAGSGLLVMQAETDKESSVHASGNDFAVKGLGSTHASTSTPQKARVTPTHCELENEEFFSSPVLDKAISPLKARGQDTFAQDDSTIEDGMTSTPVEPTFGSPMTVDGAGFAFPLAARCESPLFHNEMKKEGEQVATNLPSPSVTVAATYDEVRAEVLQRNEAGGSKERKNCVIS